MGVVSEPGIREIRDLVRFEVQYTDRLARQRLLSSVAIVQNRSIVSVRADHHRYRKTVCRAEASGCGSSEYLACRQHHGVIFWGRLPVHEQRTRQAEQDKDTRNVRGHRPSGVMFRIIGEDK